ncbi:TonB-dependent receptor [Kriegella aquimaris]|nr:TonB-dependent receptor [Kriegella aquimaris]
MKKPLNQWRSDKPLLKFDLKMKLTTLLLITTLLGLHANNSYAQKTKVTLNVENSTVRSIIDNIESKTEFRFIYKTKQIDLERKVSLRVDKEYIETVLNRLFRDTSTIYKVRGTHIILRRNQEKKISTTEIFKNGPIDQMQDFIATGVITDSDGVPLPGANIIEKGTTNGVTADFDGGFSISVKDENAVLVVSYIGFSNKEVPINGQTNISVMLEENAAGLDEVVVVGYGTQKKRDVLGSIATVKSDVLEDSSGASNFTSLLQGQAAGVSVQTSTGRLGSGVDVKIRGLSSISAGTSPLWIVDGVPIIAGAGSSAEYTSEQSPFSLINQADIESIEILKDAAATSIYGSRGSNGVIIITTKTGRKGKTSINLDYSTGVSDLPFQRVDFVNTEEWFEIRDKAKKSYGLGDYSMTDYYAGSVYLTEQLTLEQAKSIDTNWFQEAMQNGSFQSINLSASGGSEKADYFISSNYRKDKGVMLNDDLERYGFRTNVNLTSSDNFKVGAKLNFSLSNSNRGKNFGTSSSGNKDARSGGFAFLNTSAQTFNPVYSLANPKEYFNPYVGNPVALSDRDNMVQDVEMYRTLASLYGEYALPFLPQLSVRSELSLDFVQVNRNTWLSDEIRWDGSWADDFANTIRTFNYNLFLKYDKTFGDHNIIAIGGAEAQRSKSWSRRMQGEDLVGNYKQLGSPSQMTSMYSGLGGESYLLAYFGRANYKFKDKYLAGISVRRDGSSVFTPDYRWGTFMAFSAGWIMSDENFMKGFGANNFLKLRGSFGQTGNAGIPSGLDAFKYTPGNAYGSADIFATNGTLVSSIGVSNLTWETTNNFDVGLDYGLLNNRINGSLAYYNKYVKDLLLATQLPQSSGISTIYGNIGDLVNSGIEFNVSSINISKPDFKWQTTFNIASNHNEVKKLVPRIDADGAGMVSYVNITKTGYAVREYYLADFAGVDPESGISMLYALDKDYYDETNETRRLKDENGEDVKIINSNSNANANKFHLKGKNSIPAYYGGLTNSFSYKGFDLNLLITFSGGNYIFDSFYRDMATDYSGTRRMLKDVYDDYWKSPGDDAKFQQVNWNSNIKLEDGTTIGLGDPRTNTDQFLFKGDYVKFKSATLGYTVPKSTKVGSLFEGLRLYTTVENLHTITKYPGWDPEGSATSWDLPQLFSSTFGVSIKF